MNYKTEKNKNGSTLISFTLTEGCLRTYTVTGDVAVMAYDPEAGNVPDRAAMLRPVRPITDGPDVIVVLYSRYDYWRGEVDARLLQSIAARLHLSTDSLAPFLLGKFSDVARSSHITDAEASRYIAAFRSELECAANSFETVQALPAAEAPSGYPLVFEDVEL